MTKGVARGSRRAGRPVGLRPRLARELGAIVDHDRLREAVQLAGALKHTRHALARDLLSEADHIALHRAGWNEEWGEFFKKSRTPESVQAKLRRMMVKSKYAQFLKRGRPASVSHGCWSPRAAGKLAPVARYAAPNIGRAAKLFKLAGAMARHSKSIGKRAFVLVAICGVVLAENPVEAAAEEGLGFVPIVGPALAIGDVGEAGAEWLLEHMEPEFEDLAADEEAEASFQRYLRGEGFITNRGVKGW